MIKNLLGILLTTVFAQNMFKFKHINYYYLGKNSRCSNDRGYDPPMATVYEYSVLLVYLSVTLFCTHNIMLFMRTGCRTRAIRPQVRYLILCIITHTRCSRRRRCGVTANSKWKLWGTTSQIITFNFANFWNSLRGRGPTDDGYGGRGTVHWERDRRTNTRRCFSASRFTFLVGRSYGPLLASVRVCRPFDVLRSRALVCVLSRVRPWVCSCVRFCVCGCVR